MKIEEIVTCSGLVGVTAVGFVAGAIKGYFDAHNVEIHMDEGLMLGGTPIVAGATFGAFALGPLVNRNYAERGRKMCPESCKLFSSAIGAGVTLVGYLAGSNVGRYC